MTKLHELCYNGNLEEVCKLLEDLDLDDKNQTDDDGNTALHIACMKGYTEVAIALIRAGVSRSITNNKDQRAQDVMDRKDEKLSKQFSRMGTATSSDRFSEYSSEADDRMVSNQTNKFYFACRNGQVKDVKKLLENMTPNDIDRVQSNGSTALHVACYFNHHEIVEMLLKAGASRGIKNKHGCVPYEETSDKKIQSLFKRIPGNNRFVGDSGKIEWVLVTPYVNETAAAERHALGFYARHSLQELASRAKQYYLSTELKNIENSDQVMYFFQQAINKGDPRYIIKAYTAETGFYSRLNRDLAGGATSGQAERQFIVGIMTHHPAFDKYTYLGQTYRGMKMTDEDLHLYKIGSSIMAKSFLSTTKDKQTAESFALGITVRTNQSGSILKFPAFCTYIVKNKRTALAIEDVSEYRDEKEVLIMPYAVFTVKNVKQRSNVQRGSRIVDILLEESEPFVG